MANPKRGEVWLVDLGMAAKTRPCLVLSIPTDQDHDRVLVTVVAHTTAVRGSRFEVVLPASFLQPGAFDAQNLVTIPKVKLVRKLGALTTDQMFVAEKAVICWLGLPSPTSANT